MNLNISNEAAILRIRALNDSLAEKRRRPVFFIRTFGCQMNVRESEKLHGLLSEMGYDAACGDDDTAETTADLVIYNTCCVRENAENKVYGKLGYLKYLKASDPNKITVLCGCMPQRPEVLDELNAHHKHIDILFGTFNKHHFPVLLYKFLSQRHIYDEANTCWHNETSAAKPVHEILTESGESSEAPPEFGGRAALSRFFKHKAGINIMYGCDNFCAYCIVPYVRGREKSRAASDILEEVQALADDGVREVMLLGQNVNSYGFGLREPLSFAELLRRVNEVSGIKRIRFMTSHPKDLSYELICAIRDCEKVCKHIHLPLQSGSSRILEKMNRAYTQEKYLELVRRLREEIPGIAVTTDLIVGFPGETDEDFSETLKAAESARFDGAFTFIYSPREGTPAASFDGAVPEQVTKERFGRLLKLIQPLQLEHNSGFMNRITEVMVDGESDTPGVFTGRADDHTLVNFTAGGKNNIQPGDLINVQITTCKTFYISGYSL